MLQIGRFNNSKWLRTYNVQIHRYIQGIHQQNLNSTGSHGMVFNQHIWGSRCVKLNIESKQWFLSIQILTKTEDGSCLEQKFQNSYRYSYVY
jgi:hypothetical protein